MEDLYHVEFDDELLGKDWLELYAIEILDAKYQGTDETDVFVKQHHIAAKQQADLFASFKRTKAL
jgi:hypothetical protein